MTLSQPISSPVVMEVEVEDMEEVVDMGEVGDMEEGTNTLVRDTGEDSVMEEDMVVGVSWNFK